MARGTTAAHGTVIPFLRSTIPSCSFAFPLYAVKNNPRLRPIPDIAHGTHIIQEGRHITIIFYRVAHGTHIISRSYAFPGGVFARTYTYAHTHIAKHTHTNFTCT